MPRESEVEQAAFRLIRDWVVLRRLFDHLYLAKDRGVFHDKLGRLAAPDAERAHGIVQHIAFRGSDLLHLDLDFALAVCQQVVQFDVAVLIGTVLANQVVVPILDEKAYPIDALACHGVDLLMRTPASFSFSKVTVASSPDVTITFCGVGSSR